MTLFLGCVAASAQLPKAPPKTPPATAQKSRVAKPRPIGKILPISPFPSRTHFTLALNNQLVAPPAYQEGYGYYPIEDDRIVAYDLMLGSQLWIAAAKPRWAPAIGDGLLFVDSDEGLSALRASDGATAWSTPSTDKLVAPLVWERGWLIAVTAAELLAFRAADGMLVWRQPVSGIRAAPAMGPDRLYLSLNDGRVLALRVDTGVQVWERKLPGPPNEILAIDDRLFVGSNDNYMYSLKAEDGVVDWRVRTGADVISRPIADRDRIYFVSLDNVLRALNRSNGVQQWKKALPFRPAWRPLRAADTVVVAGITGSARAYLLKDGAAAGELAVDAAAEVAAPLHAFDTGAALGPIVIVVTRTIAEGATIMAVSHTIEPTVAPFTPLPGVIPVPLSAP